LDKLKNLYLEINEPINFNYFGNGYSIPTRKVYAKAFGTWQNACKIANVPFKASLNRIGEENINYQGCLMRITKYNKSNNIEIEFQDQYKTHIKSTYGEFKRGQIKNPYFPSVYGVGIIGNKYSIENNGELAKEYRMWTSMILRCFDKKYKIKAKTYKDVTCCDEWLLYENFYEWLHSQDNFYKLLNSDFSIDKDILIKGNKIYDPKKCCLVPRVVNNLFVKRTNDRGKYPIGVTKHGNKYRARCDNPLSGIRVHLGVYNTPDEAFLEYKKYKEQVIKRVAEIEYSKKNITEECYNAMLKYEVEISD
jgi:hypothetical protein